MTATWQRGVVKGLRCSERKEKKDKRKNQDCPMIECVRHSVLFFTHNSNTTITCSKYADGQCPHCLNFFQNEKCVQICTVKLWPNIVDRSCKAHLSILNFALSSDQLPPQVCYNLSHTLTLTIGAYISQNLRMERVAYFCPLDLSLEELHHYSQVFEPCHQDVIIFKEADVKKTVQCSLSHMWICSSSEWSGFYL